MPISSSIRELEILQASLRESFGAAARGQPWPQQVALRVAEQVLLMGVCGTLLVRFASLGTPGLSHPRGEEIQAVLRWLEQHSFAPLLHSLPEMMHGLAEEVLRNPGLAVDHLRVQEWVLQWLVGLTPRQ